MAVAAIGRVLQRQSLDPLHHFGRGGLRVAPVDRRQVFQPLKALRLKPPLPFVEAGPVQAALATRLGDVAQLPGQFETLRRCCASLLAESRGAAFFAVDDCPIASSSFPKIARKEG